MGIRFISFLLALLLWSSPALGHFPVLTHGNQDWKKGQKVTATLQYGHPFENEWEDCPEPESVRILGPDGVGQPVKPSQAEFESGGKKYVQWKVEFTPQTRGDYLVQAQWKPRPAKKDEPLVKEVAQTWVHVQQEIGWDQPQEGWTSLHRPYGLHPGMIYRARLGSNGGGGSDIPFEYEYLSPEPPAKLPRSTLITFTGKTDKLGNIAVSFPKAGWWAISAEVPGKPGPADSRPASSIRHVLWIFVDRAD